MESFSATTRKVGNSVGLLIPAEMLEKSKLKTGQKVRVTISPMIDERIRGRFSGHWTAKDLDDFMKERKDAWGD